MTFWHESSWFYWRESERFISPSDTYETGLLLLTLASSWFASCVTALWAVWQEGCYASFILCGTWHQHLTFRLKDFFFLHTCMTVKSVKMFLNHRMHLRWWTDLNNRTENKGKFGSESQLHPCLFVCSTRSCNMMHKNSIKSWHWRHFLCAASSYAWGQQGRTAVKKKKKSVLISSWCRNVSGGMISCCLVKNKHAHLHTHT